MEAELPYIIILDVMMPEINGFDVAAVLKNDPATMDIPIMALTIMSSPKFVQECYRAGIIGYIKKPYDPKILLDSRPLDGFASTKSRALFTFLAVEAGKTHSRDALATLLWPDYDQSKAFANLRRELARRSGYTLPTSG